MGAEPERRVYAEPSERICEPAAATTPREEPHRARGPQRRQQGPEGGGAGAACHACFVRPPVQAAGRAAGQPAACARSGGGRRGRGARPCAWSGGGPHTTLPPPGSSGARSPPSSCRDASCWGRRPREFYCLGGWLSTWVGLAVRDCADDGNWGFGVEQLSEACSQRAALEAALQTKCDMESLRRGAVYGCTPWSPAEASRENVSRRRQSDRGY